MAQLIDAPYTDSSTAVIAKLYHASAFAYNVVNPVIRSVTGFASAAIRNNSDNLNSAAAIISGTSVIVSAYTTAHATPGIFTAELDVVTSGGAGYLPCSATIRIPVAVYNYSWPLVQNVTMRIYAGDSVSSNVFLPWAGEQSPRVDDVMLGGNYASAGLSAAITSSGFNLTGTAANPGIYYLTADYTKRSTSPQGYGRYGYVCLISVSPPGVSSGAMVLAVPDGSGGWTGIPYVPPPPPETVSVTVRAVVSSVVLPGLAALLEVDGGGTVPAALTPPDSVDTRGNAGLIGGGLGGVMLHPARDLRRLVPYNGISDSGKITVSPVTATFTASTVSRIQWDQGSVEERWRSYAGGEWSRTNSTIDSSWSESSTIMTSGGGIMSFPSGCVRPGGMIQTLLGGIASGSEFGCSAGAAMTSRQERKYSEETNSRNYSTYLRADQSGGGVTASVVPFSSAIADHYGQCIFMDADGKTYAVLNGGARMNDMYQNFPTEVSYDVYSSRLDNGSSWESRNPTSSGNSSFYTTQITFGGYVMSPEPMGVPQTGPISLVSGVTAWQETASLVTTRSYFRTGVDSSVVHSTFLWRGHGYLDSSGGRIWLGGIMTFSSGSVRSDYADPSRAFYNSASAAIYSAPLPPWSSMAASGSTSYQAQTRSRTIYEKTDVVITVLSGGSQEAR